MYFVIKPQKLIAAVAIAGVLSALALFSSLSRNENLCSNADIAYTFETIKNDTDATTPKKVYLTFDDGPSKNTEKLLDILKENNVVATFFVIADENNIDYLPLITRAENEGNAIALHSQSHEYKDIYKNTAAFWSDIEKLKAAITPYITKMPKIMRFPGGSTNTISHRYGGNGIMKSLKAQALDKGYKFVDWNVSAEDSVGGHPSAETIYSLVVKESKGKNTCVVLFHDSKPTKTTAQALPDIIKYYKDNGYTFDTIDHLDSQI